MIGECPSTTDKHLKQLSQLTYINQHKHRYKSVSFTDIKLNFDFLVLIAASHSELSDTKTLHYHDTAIHLFLRFDQKATIPFFLIITGSYTVLKLQEERQQVICNPSSNANPLIYICFHRHVFCIAQLFTQKFLGFCMCKLQQQLALSVQSGYFYNINK